MSLATPDVLELPLWIDLTAVVAGALAGAVFGVREQLDVIGVLSIAVVMGLGGGIVRDLLLSVRPVALTNPAYLPTAIAAAVVGLLLAPLVRRMGHVFALLDGISLGLFTVVGVEKGLLFDLPRTSAVVLGVAAACGGSVLRDLLSGHPPEIVRRGPWNATAAAAGAVAYCLLSVAGAPIGWCETVTVALTTGLRLLSVYRGWETPLPSDLTPSLARPSWASREALRPWRRPSPADPPGPAGPDAPPDPASEAP